MGDVLIHLRPKNDFEKRLFAERQVKDLQEEIGKLKAYIAELEDFRKKHRGNDPAWTPEEKMFIRRDEQVMRLKEKNKSLNKLVKSLRETNSELITKLNSK